MVPSPEKAATMVPLPLHSICIRAALLAALMLASQSAFAQDPIEAKAKVCAPCHGEAGIPIQKNIPVIWGQNAGYLIYQLRDFKSGARKNDIMSPIAATIDPADVSALATYFSKLKWPNLQQLARGSSAIRVGDECRSESIV
jgi:cytochrome c553